MSDHALSDASMLTKDQAAMLAHAAELDEQLADLYYSGDFAQAELLGREILAIRERVLDDPQLPTALSNLGGMLVEQGQYEEAEPLLRRALAMLDDGPAPQSLGVTAVLNTLATLHELRGEYVEARPLFERALSVLQAELKENDPLIGAALNNLARLVLTQGDASAARPLFERALRIMEAEFGPHSAHVATPLNNLAMLLVARGEHSAAREMFERVLQIREVQLGPDHPHLAISAGNLGLLLIRQGVYWEAQDHLERALAISERAIGPVHLQCSLILDALGWIAANRGEHDRARVLYERALSILEATTEDDHLFRARGLSNFAYAEWRAHRAADARTLILRAAAVLNANVADVFITLAPAEQRAFVHEWLDGMTALAFSFFASEPAAFPAAYASVAGWKGLLLLGLRHQSSVFGLPDHLAAIRDARLRVAHAVGWDDPAELAAAESERERLERAIARALPMDSRFDRWIAGEPAGFVALQASLPPAAAFVDIYEHVIETSGNTIEWRYSAVLMTRGTTPLLIDLGPSATLDATADAWRGRRMVADHSIAELAAALWGPVAAALPAGTARAWVAPDGALSRIPWSVLAEARQREHPEAGLLAAQIPSARALLDLLASTPTERAGTVFLVGDVDFGYSQTGGHTVWDELPATADEVRDVADRASAAGLFPRLLLGGEATPAGVALGAQQAEYVHVATHGFFGGYSSEEYAARMAEASRLVSPLLDGSELPVPAAGFAERSPLATSGLALAGANVGPEGNLTAEEIVGLDLRKARLVVLSACDTGRGAEVTGQGVLGLQAAVQAAGARALLMSLWPVPDDATAVLMGSFYRCLWEEKRSPAVALSQAQNQVRSREGWEAPVYWAGWSLVGDAF
jgi:CHAT domain-containing protein/tetratricopeptide (TPR) repeat protein